MNDLQKKLLIVSAAAFIVWFFLAIGNDAFEHLFEGDFKDFSETAIYTSSDYRMKENVVSLTGATSRIKNLKPKRFNFKEDDKTIDGFLAHEVSSVVPEAVTGEKDGTEMQQLDYSKLATLTVAALQEAIAKIEALEAKVTALESA